MIEPVYQQTGFVWAGPIPYEPYRAELSVRNGFPALWKQAEKLNPMLVRDRCMSM